MIRFQRFLALSLLAPALLGAQTSVRRFTHADTLRGSNGPGRAWWDATFYDLHVAVNPADSSIRGWNAISYRVLEPATQMQIDLQVPLVIDSIVQDGRHLTARRDSNAFFVTLQSPQQAGASRTLSVYYHGKPKVAKRPPWDGGLTWQHDSLGNEWIATTNEGLGASVWWPNKDYLADEPDSQRIAITVPSSLIDVSNGRLRTEKRNDDGTTTYEWFVTSPINNYDVEINAGHYEHFSDVYKGESGELTLDFWPLAYHLDTARVQFQQVKPMLKCFEHWFGPYPWYADGYKLIEAPHLGMEHQSGVAYGNHYKNGYAGRDLSQTGWGLKWDFIIVHESAHEWWGNNITTKDAADMWIHESFANYAEGLYAECQDGKEAGDAYIIGSRKLIKNREPIVGPYGVNQDGSEDMYYKGGSMLHTIRQLVNDDEKWRGILRGLQSTFWHRTVTGAEVEQYITKQSGLALGPLFDEYLRTTKVPALEYKIENGRMSYRWTDVVPGFAMPVRVAVGDSTEYSWITPTAEWKTMPRSVSSGAVLRVDPNFYVTVKNASPGASSPGSAHGAASGRLDTMVKFTGM